MKNKKILKTILLTIMLLVIGAGQVASAGAIGDDYTLWGYQAGWWIIGLAILAFVLAYFGVLSKKKIGTVGVALLVIGGILVVPIETTEVTGQIADTKCCPFEVTGSAITTGANYISSAVWDEDELTFTIPLTVSDSSDGNLSAHKTGLNLTFEPMCEGKTAEDITLVSFSSDYLMKYGGEYLLDEDSTNYLAVWTTTEGDEYIDDTMKITADTSDWAQIDYTFNNNTAGNWVTELDQIGDSKTWYITASNSCGTWSETITVTAIVVSYTA